MGLKRKRLLAFFVSALISLPLLAELIRKYVYQSNLVLPVTDVMVLIITLALIKWSSNARANAVFGILILANVGWGLITIAFGHQDFLLGLIGIRNFLVPCAFLAIGAIFANILGAYRYADLLLRVFTFWLFILTIAAVLQLSLGRDHWINELPPGLGNEGQGIGDYTADGVWLEYMFRPTSIFLHTGKLGAVLFVLTVYRLCYAVSYGSITSFWAGRVFDLMALLISGQRAAIIGYFFLGIYFLAMRNRPSFATTVIMVTIGAMGLTVFGLISSAGDSENSELMALLATRIATGIKDIPVRITDNIILPMDYVIDRYSFSPAGLGAFSLGTEPFGGQPLYEIVPIGTAESSWLRILAEQGLVGLVLAGVFWVALVIYSLRAWWNARIFTVTKPDPKSNLSIISASPALILGVLLLWANTHDVLGNVTLMSLAMLTFGVVLARPQEVRAAFWEFSKEERCYDQSSLHG